MKEDLADFTVRLEQLSKPLLINFIWEGSNEQPSSNIESFLFSVSHCDSSVNLYVTVPMLFFFKL